MLSEETKRKISETLRGRHLTEETKYKMSQAHKCEQCSLEYRKKLSLARQGKHHSEKTKNKISESLQGKHHNKETKQKMSEGKKNISLDTRRKLSEGRRGKLHSEATKLRMSEAHRGAKNYLWQGGISFLPYPVTFNRQLKKKIKTRDSFSCQICGKQKGLVCHHIDYDKQNNDMQNLITLCRSCHIYTNVHREKWTIHFDWYLMPTETTFPKNYNVA